MVKKLLSIILVGLTIISAGCAKKPSFKPKPIRSLKNQPVDFQTTQKNVTIRAKRLTAADCEQIFGEEGSQKLKGTCSLQVSFENNSDEIWHLLDKNISLKLEKSKRILQKLSTSGFKQGLIAGTIILGAGLALSVGGILALTPLFLTAPSMIINICTGAAFCGACLGTFMVFPGTPFAMMIASGIDNEKNNAGISEYLKETALGKAIVIKPRKTIDLLLFVQEKNFKDDFEITLLNDELDEELPFAINLKKPGALPKTQN